MAGSRTLGPTRRSFLTDRPYLRDAGELALVALAFLLYFVVRANVVDNPDRAFANAGDLLRIERDLGIDWEADVQGAVLGSRPLVKLSNLVYFWLDFPLIAAVGLLLYGLRRRQYTFARDAILFSGGLALIFYALLPVAPPRLLPEAGVIDTLQRYSNLSYQAQSTQFFVNPYAAVPSLHVGWAFLLSAGVIWAFWPNKLVLAAAVLHPLAQTAATVLTGNHYLLDAVAGFAVAAAGLAFAVLMQRWGYAVLGRALGVDSLAPLGDLRVSS